MAQTFFDTFLLFSFSKNVEMELDISASVCYILFRIVEENRV